MTNPASSPAVALPRRRVAALLAGGALLVAASWVVAVLLAPLAFTRSFHVDEIQIAYNAALLGRHHLPEAMNVVAPFLVPLSWLTGGEESWRQLLAMRAGFLALFVFDLVLVAACAPRVRGFPARAATLLALLLVEPFWRHGFEIRHDLLMLAGSLGLFALTQRAAAGRTGTRACVLAGLLAALMQFNSFKAFLVWPVALVMMLVLERAASGRLRLGRALLAIAGGGVLGAAICLALLAGAGIAGDFARQVTALAGSAAEARRFAAGTRILALLGELPHLTLLAALGVGAAAVAARRGGWRAELSSLATALWLLLVVLALHANPVPFTYNLVHLIPFLFLAAVDGCAALWARLRPTGRVLLALGVSAATLLGFRLSWAADGIGRAPGTAQRAHIEAVEALTGEDDPFLDGAGLVLTRRPPERDWMLHSLTMPAYRRGERRSFRDQLAREPVPVLLSNYRWEWLDRADGAFVRTRYLAVGPRLFVLGGRRADASGSFEVFRAGRYLVRGLDPGARVELDGAELSGAVAELAAGAHVWSGGGLAWAWLGPRSGSPPAPPPLLPNGDLFVSD